LLVALIVLAFAQPYIYRQVLPRSRSGEITVFAIDNSLSMRTGSRLDEAKRRKRDAGHKRKTGRQFGECHARRGIRDDVDRREHGFGHEISRLGCEGPQTTGETHADAEPRIAHLPVDPP